MRSFAFAAACSLGLLACADEPELIVDNFGVDHTFVISGLELDSVDNQVGAAIGSLTSLAPSLGYQATLDEQIDRGEPIQLVNINAGALSNSASVGLLFYEGSADGAGMLHVDPGSDESLMSGNIIGGVFVGGGSVTVQLSLGGAPFRLPLVGAHAELVELADTGWSSGSRLGGGILEADLDDTVKPALAGSLQTTFAATCEVGGPPPACNCDADGAAIAGLVDVAPQDCTLSDAEIAAVLDDLLALDLDADGDGTNDAASISLGVTGVAATFTVP